MLAFLLMRCRRAHASDQRDKVYSLLGMAKFAATVKGAPPTCIEVDYTDSSTPGTVFTKATTFILEECNHLAFISLASLITCKDGENLELTPDLPSWVPDFSTSAQHATIMPLICYSKHYEFDASWYRELGSLGLRIDGAELHVKAVRIGTLSAVSASVAEALMRTWEFEPFAALLLQCPPALHSYRRAGCRGLLAHSHFRYRDARRTPSEPGTRQCLWMLGPSDNTLLCGTLRSSRIRL